MHSFALLALNVNYLGLPSASRMNDCLNAEAGSGRHTKDYLRFVVNVLDGAFIQVKVEYSPLETLVEPPQLPVTELN